MTIILVSTYVKLKSFSRIWKNNRTKVIQKSPSHPHHLTHIFNTLYYHSFQLPRSPSDAGTPCMVRPVTPWRHVPGNEGAMGGRGADGVAAAGARLAAVLPSRRPVSCRAAGGPDAVYCWWGTGKTLLQVWSHCFSLCFRPLHLTAE